MMQITLKKLNKEKVEEASRIIALYLWLPIELSKYSAIDKSLHFKEIADQLVAENWFGV